MQIKVKIKNNSYPIHIGSGYINKCSTFIKHKGQCLIITDSGVPKEYSEIVEKQINCAGIYTFKQGEKNKNIKTLMDILTEMQRVNLNRGDYVIAIGGGVVGDLTGFASSIYMRGIDFYNIPTTYLSMVDSSIGGKTGIDFNGIKNSVGTFYQPKGVIIDSNVLHTLPKRQLMSGMCETLKINAILFKEMFEYLENTDVSKYDIDGLISVSCNLKKMVVELDEKEQDLRRILNFGHTLGHGIEESCNGKLFHGECVGLGMIAISDGEVRERIKKVLEKLHIKTRAKFDIDKAIDLVLHDKKSTSDGVVCVKVKEIGSFEYETLNREELYERLKVVWEE